MVQPIEDTRDLATVAIHGTILVLSTILSLMGNSLVCIAFYRNRRLRIITNFYVVSLAVTDIIMTIFSFPFTAIASSLQKWPFNFNFCQFNGFIVYVWSGISVIFLALTAINRYICIVKPHLYPILFTRKKTLFSILSVSLLTFTACLIAALAVAVSFEWHPLRLFCDVTGMENRALVSASVAGFITTAMSLIVFCYGSVFHAIRRHNVAVNPSLQETTRQGSVSAHEIQASRVLLAAVIGFCVCWIPMTIIRLLEGFAHWSLPPFWVSFSSLVAFLSSWINPIIYGVMNRAMGKQFLKLLRCRSE